MEVVEADVAAAVDRAAAAWAVRVVWVVAGKMAAAVMEVAWVAGAVAAVGWEAVGVDKAAVKVVRVARVVVRMGAEAVRKGAWGGGEAAERAEGSVDSGEAVATAALAAAALVAAQVEEEGEETRTMMAEPAATDAD